MDLHQIAYFLAVVDHKGINAAAAALGLAQPTVSQAVRELERTLRVDLFHRVGRGMVLTSAGHALVGPARRMLRDVVAAEGALPDAAGQLRGRLDLCARPAVLGEPVSRLLGAFRRQHPKVSVHIGDLPDEETATQLIRDGHCEILVCHLPLPGTEGLAVRELGVQEHWMVFPPGTELPPDDPLPLAALPDIPPVVVPRGGALVGRIEREIARAGQLRRPAAVLQHSEARLAFVMAGIGSTLVERSLAQAAAARGAVARATEPGLSAPYGLVYDPATLSRAGQAFVELAPAPHPG